MFLAVAVASPSDVAMFLQFGGLGLAIYGLNETAKQFMVNFRAVFGAWWQRLPWIRRNVKKTPHSGAMNIQGRSLAGFVSVNPSASGTLEDQIKIIAAKIVELESNLKKMNDRLDTQITKVDVSIAEESKNRQMENSAIMEFIKRAVAPRLQIEAIAAFCILIGIGLSSHSVASQLCS